MRAPRATSAAEDTLKKSRTAARPPRGVRDRRGARLRSATEVRRLHYAVCATSSPTFRRLGMANSRPVPAGDPQNRVLWYRTAPSTSSGSTTNNATRRRSAFAGPLRRGSAHRVKANGASRHPDLNGKTVATTTSTTFGCCARNAPPGGLRSSAARTTPTASCCSSRPRRRLRHGRPDPRRRSKAKNPAEFASSASRALSEPVHIMYRRTTRRSETRRRQFATCQERRSAKCTTSGSCSRFRLEHEGRSAAAKRPRRLEAISTDKPLETNAP